MLLERFTCCGVGTVKTDVLPPLCPVYLSPFLGRFFILRARFRWSGRRQHTAHHQFMESQRQTARERERERERGNCESADRMSRSNVVTLTRGLTSSPAITKKKCRRKCRRRRPWTRRNVSESRHRNATSHLFYRAEPR